LAGYDQRANLAFGRKRLDALAEAIDGSRSEDIERSGVADRQTDDPAGVALDTAIVI
jgi:hypothetical protein